MECDSLNNMLRLAARNKMRPRKSSFVFRTGTLLKTTPAQHAKASAGYEAAITGTLLCSVMNVNSSTGKSYSENFIIV